MLRVAVVGAGAAGIEAARVAASNGARVVLLEEGDKIPSPKSAWPALLESGTGRPGRPTETELEAAGIELHLNQSVSKVGDDLSVVVGGRRTPYDAVILTTGSSSLPDRLDGDRKHGVHVLDSEAAYSELDREVGGYAKAVVAGSGPAAVKVAEKLRSRQVSVAVLAPGGVFPALNRGPRRVVAEAISSWGIQVIDAKAQKVVGVDKAEAIVASGEVIPGDCFVMVPRSVPRLPEVNATLGRLGGLVVDERTKSSRQSLYGAGDCAEVRVGSTTMSVMFESSAKLMGAVSGTNASGRRASASVVGSFSMEIAGVGVASAGVGVGDAAGLGLDAAEVSKNWMGELACSILFDKHTKTVLGVQLAGKGVAVFAESLPIIVAARMTVEQLAYSEAIASSDISPVIETAREGVSRL